MSEERTDEEKEEINLLEHGFFTPGGQKWLGDWIKTSPYQKKLAERRRKNKEQAEGKDE